SSLDRLRALDGRGGCASAESSWIEWFNFVGAARQEPRPPFWYWSICVARREPRPPLRRPQIASSIGDLNYFEGGAADPGDASPLARPSAHLMPPRMCSWYFGFAQTSGRWPRAV